MNYLCLHDSDKHQLLDLFHQHPALGNSHGIMQLHLFSVRLRPRRPSGEGYKNASAGRYGHRRWDTDS